MAKKQKRKPKISDEMAELIQQVQENPFVPDNTERLDEKVQQVSSEYAKPKTLINRCVNTTDYVKNRVKKLKKTTDRLPVGKDLDSISDDDLFSILEESTQVSMSVREALIGTKDPLYVSRREKLCGQIYNIVVGHPEGTILRVSLPPLVQARYKGSYDIYRATKIMLSEYYSKHERPVVQGEKLLLLYKKYAKDLTADYTCDNDNWEAKRVTNAISEALLYSDNAEHFSMMYTAVKSDRCYVEATVICLANLPKFTDYILDPIPAQPL